MADVRALLKAKRQEARITHPYAAYNPSGQLKCTVCSSVIKHASAWEGHLGSKVHRTNIQRLREEEKRQQQSQEQEQTPQPEESHSPEPTRKRKPVEDQTQSNSGSEKKRKIEPPVNPPQASSSSFPNDFFSDPSRGPVPLSYSDDEEDEEDAKPATEIPNPPSAAASGVDEEYARFQRELLSTSADPAEAYDRATIAAEPVLASTQIPGFPPTATEDTPEEAPKLTEEEAREKREQEERELIMDKLLAEERAQEDADTRVQLMKTKLENLRKKREAAKANKHKDTR